MESLTQIFKAMSDPIRLRILSLLMQQDSFCVCELVNILGLSQSTVSRHLSYLKNSGLVTSWREGVWMHYALKSDAIQFLDLTTFKAQLNQHSEIQADNQRCSDKVSNCPIPQ